MGIVAVTNSSNLHYQKKKKKLARTQIEAEKKTALSDKHNNQPNVGLLILLFHFYLYLVVSLCSCFVSLSFTSSLFYSHQLSMMQTQAQTLRNSHLFQTHSKAHTSVAPNQSLNTCKIDAHPVGQRVVASNLSLSMRKLETTNFVNFTIAKSLPNPTPDYGRHNL